MLLRGQNLLGYRHYQDEVVQRFCDKATENGVDVFRIFDALNDLRNIEQAVNAVKRNGRHAQGCISYTISPIHTISHFVEKSRSLFNQGVDSICIKDMAALLKPQAAFDLISGIKQACPGLRIHLHCHATTGVTMASYIKAVEAGVDCVDTAVSAMSLGPGHNPTESFIEMLDGTGYASTVDISRVIRIKNHFAKTLSRYSQFASSVVGVDTEIFLTQIPGGMLSNLDSQLRDMNAMHRRDEVMAEIPEVRKDTGYVPLVTPTSQIVGTQAVLNVLMGRYRNMTNEFADLMLGYYGCSIGEKNGEVLAMAARRAGKQPISCRPADLLEPEWDRLKSEALGLPGNNGSDKDVLTHAMFPQLAPAFFSCRHQGPINLGQGQPANDKHQDSASAEPPMPPGTYDVTVNNNRFRVTVENLSS